MDGNEIIHCINKIPLLKPFFLGIFSIDNIPENVDERCFFICNLSKLKDPGTHWIAFVRPSKNALEIFDSLSLNLEKIKPFLPFKEPFTLLLNETNFQSFSSTSCGKFVIYFSFHRLVNLDLNFKLLLESIFTNDTEANEQKVNNFYDEIINGKW